MFTGIIECLGEVISVDKDRSNLAFGIRSAISAELKIDQSIAHDGICLTVTKVENDVHWVTAIAETINKSNISEWQIGYQVNLERCLKLSDRLDGHMVQGHVDITGTCTDKKEEDGSWVFTFTYPESSNFLTVEKGSITVNGTSLTVFDSKESSFCVAIIPYTYEYTNFNRMNIGSTVNLEFDILGKYIQTILKRNEQV
jgi:riboflavin synthase